MGDDTKLPPLKALVALECVVRHRSVSQAAEELCVTHGAVSKQLARLGDWIDTPLFYNNRRGMAPTPAAERLAAGIHDGLCAIKAALEEIDAGPSKDAMVDIIAPATFAIYWLLPRLPQLRRSMPTLRTQVRYTHTGDRWQDLSFDLAIRLRQGEAPGFDETPLFRDTLCLMAAPALATSLKTAGDIRALPLLESETRPGELDAWLRAAGLTRGEVKPVERFEHNYVAVEAALAGQGAVVAPRHVLAGHCSRGALAVAWPAVSVPGPSYVAVHDPRAKNARAVRACAAYLASLKPSSPEAAAVAGLAAASV
ncbi:MAG: LysR substrate-binding domain-containing protein [Pseudomonadota bacterium]